MMKSSSDLGLFWCGPCNSLPFNILVVGPFFLAGYPQATNVPLLMERKMSQPITRGY